MNQGVETILKRTVLPMLIFIFLFIQSETNAENESTVPLVKRIMARVECNCGCNMVLEVCEKEDPTCTTRPVIISRIERLIRDGKGEEEIIKILKGEITPAKNAMRQARKENKFLFLFFYEKGSAESEQMANIIKEAESKWRDKADFISIDINDNKEREIISEYRIWRAPVTLVMAPNEVIVAGFPGVARLDDLKEAFISPKMVELIGGLQQRKVIFLCIQNENTKYTEENSKVVKDTTEILGKSVKVVEIDPKDKREEKLLKRIDVNPDITDSVVIVISQRGMIGDSFKGKVTEKELFASFKKVLAQRSGCGSGGAGGCGG